MTETTYTCACCYRTFNKGWTDAEALTELNEKFVGYSPDDCDLVCDDCYKAMGFGS